MAALRDFLIFAVTGLIQPCWAASLADFTKCIGAQGQGGVCQLDPGTYSISATLHLGRSNITIKGTIVTSRSDTVLQRAPGFQGALLQDVVPPSSTPTLTAITIRDLTIDGNRAQNGDAYTSYQPDVQVFTTNSLLVANCDFINSPNLGLALYGAGAAGIVVSNSSFENPVIYGVWSGPTGNHSGLNYSGCSSVQLPDNVVIANSQFWGAGENAILAATTHLQVVSNVFTDTHSFSVGSFVPSGGQVDLTPCTNTASVWGSTFQGGQHGPGDGLTQGIELHGTDISLINNLVEANWSDGISIGGAANVFIADWDPGYSFVGNSGAGVAIHQGDPGATDSQRPVDFITIDNVRIINNSHSGIWANDAAVPVNHLAIRNNCLQGNASPQINLSMLGPDVATSNNSLSGCGPN